MILEAFSEVLRQEFARGGPTAVDILHRWLLGLLSDAHPDDNVSRVIHTELALVDVAGHPMLISKSATGQTLLNSLYLYCEGYEHWQFRRWLHQIQPQSFQR